MTQTPGQRTASTVLDLIDGAIGGDTSPDAMRWTPEPEPVVGTWPTSGSATYVSDALDAAMLGWRYLAAASLAAQVADLRCTIRITEV